MRARNIQEGIENILKPKSSDEIALEFLYNNIENQREARASLMNEIKNFNPEDYANEVEAFVYLISNNYLGSAMEIYLSEDKQKKLFKLFKKGYNIATYFIDYDDIDTSTDEYVSKVSKFIKHAGWEKFHFEDNMSQGEFIFVKPPQANESFILKGKTKEEIEKAIPQNIVDIISDCFELIEANENRFTIVNKFGYNRDLERYGVTHYFGFKFMDSVNNVLYTVLHDGDNVLLAGDDNHNSLWDIDNVGDLMFILHIYEPLHESDIFKPKSDDEIKKSFEEKFPFFAEIFYQMFPGEDYSLYKTDFSVSAKFVFTSSEENEEEITFLISQDHHHNYPQISYLKKVDDAIISGIFVNQTTVLSKDEVMQYVNRIRNMLKK